MRRISFLLFVLILCSAAFCWAAQEFPISSFNIYGKDEDPSIIRARDGRYFISWFSNRWEGDHIFVSSSSDGEHWADPIQVTKGKNRNYFPNLYQDSKGTFHLSWFQVNIWPPFHRRVMYNQSADGVTWSPASEVAVTAFGEGADWVPVIIGRGQELRIYFASQKKGDRSRDLYVVRSTDSGQSWQSPEKLEGVNAEKLYDDYPYVVLKDDGEWMLVWTRYRKPFVGLFDKSMDIFLAKSSDGIHWNNPVNLTEGEGPNVTDVLPALYKRHDGGWSLSWTTSFENPRGAIVSRPLEATNSDLKFLQKGGYSARIIALQDQNRYLMVWVNRQDKNLRIFGKIFKE